MQGFLSCLVIHNIYKLLWSYMVNGKWPETPRQVLSKFHCTIIASVHVQPLNQATYARQGDFLVIHSSKTSLSLVFICNAGSREKSFSSSGFPNIAWGEYGKHQMLAFIVSNTTCLKLNMQHMKSANTNFSKMVPSTIYDRVEFLLWWEIKDKLCKQLQESLDLL